MNREQIIQTLKAYKPTLEKKYPLKSLALFGSYARNEQTAESDIDVMVEFSEPVGIEFIDLVIELENILQRPVDPCYKEKCKTCPEAIHRKRPDLCLNVLQRFYLME